MTSKRRLNLVDRKVRSNTGLQIEAVYYNEHHYNLTNMLRAYAMISVHYYTMKSTSYYRLTNYIKYYMNKLFLSDDNDFETFIEDHSVYLEKKSTKEH